MVRTILLIVPVVLSLALPTSAKADEGPMYFYEDGAHVVNTGVDTGYTGENPISHDDPHFGWSLGSFYVSGFTRWANVDGKVTFLKNVGDTVTLGFTLDQDINSLEGSADYVIWGDTNGFDERMGVEKTDFGRGALLVRKTVYENHVGDPQIYTDYFAALEVGAPTEIALLEEGDYEVVLDYETRERGFLSLFSFDPLPRYENYRLEFSFSVRNGNCMVYPFDSSTGSELSNASYTENGFYLDLAKSRYLKVDIERQVLNDSGTELVADTRFNRPAKDGEKYTEEGIYVITVVNPSTERSTTKTIYVGTNPVLKSHATTGLSIEEIQNLVSSGGEIQPDGTIITHSGSRVEAQTAQEVSVSLPTERSTEVGEGSSKESNFGMWLILIAVTVVAGICFAAARLSGRRKEENRVDGA